MTTIKLRDVFTAEQLQHITAVYNRHNGEVSEIAKELRPYFRGLSEQLEKHGLLPDYAAYAVPWFIKRGK